MAEETADRIESYDALVKRAQNADGSQREQLFNRLIDNFSFAAQSWAVETLGDFQAAQDAVQEAFITAYTNLDDLREPEAFPAWLRRIVQTQCHRQLRHTIPVIPLDDDNLPTVGDVSTEAEQRILYGHLREAVGRLPEHERVVTEMYYLGGYSQQEISDRLGLTLPAVKKRLQRAREHLRETMPPVNQLMLRAA